ncbi:MAG TPA: MBL fold metallo-hydrolase [Candidatus Cloacimonetes bacterium]|nr:MBL fold metallo-hydrolase [Candidatus Cloacimonadota bacterium]HEX38154.1 MBL fold metallo-hydrolase [Candidatus Cloacimonadota bacterium]
MKVRVLASGSKGNCILVSGEQTSILIDAGLSMRKIKEILFEIDFPVEKIKAILISHEHSDHIKGAGAIARNFRIPLLVNEATYRVGLRRFGRIPELIHFENGQKFTFNDLLIDPFSVPHDSVDSSCFLISERGYPHKLGVITDLGYPTMLVKEMMKKPSTVILESNHDIDMLINGPYQWWLKQRVKGKNGHLSNIQAIELLEEVLHDGLKNIVLAHLSEVNNKPDLAFNSMQRFLKERQAMCNLFIAEQYKPTEWIEV